MKKLVCTFSILIFILAACTTTKNIPEGQYLLDGFEVKHDTKNATSDLEAFVRQQPNSSFPLFGKVRLKIYNMGGQDTSKWINRFLRKIGKPPVIYSNPQTAISASQLLKQLNNQGYLNAEVDTTLKVKGKKIKVIYNLQGHTPYRIRNYSYAIDDTAMSRLMDKVPLKPLLNRGDFYDIDMLEEERLQVNKIMRNAGYYDFSKEYVYFKVDSTLNSHEVDLYMNIYPPKDSIAYRRYRFDKITVISGINSLDNIKNPDGSYNTSRWFFKNADTTRYGGIEIIRAKNNFLRSSAINKNNYLKTGARYADYNQTKTYEAFSKMAAVRQVNITNTPSHKDSTSLLDATIILLPANTHWFKSGLDGTHSAGDIGIAPSISYQHQNLFNGAEQLNIRLKGAYEFLAGNKGTELLNKSYYEYGIETSLSFPQFLFPWLRKSWREQPTATTQFSIGLNNQHRSEYTRQFFNATINYGWATRRNSILHGLDLFDINYIRMPRVSDKFREDYLNNTNNALLRESYRDQLVARTAYTTTFSNTRRFSALYPTYTVRTSIEVAGFLPRLATSINGAKLNVRGEKTIAGVAYAEYLKGTFDYSRTFYFSKLHSLAYRAAFGAAFPYGNSKTLPFERRFFGGGANSVRGWSTRSLGPGSYQPVLILRSSSSTFVNRTGDLKLEFSVENRYKVSSLFEFAQFIDAGNIWTLKNSKEQLGGLFELKDFYKEIAVSYGVGLRLDLNFLLLRFDVGMKAYDPGLDLSDRFVLHKPRLNRMAFHFGIGYPF